MSDDLSIVLTDRAYLEGPRWHDDRIWVADFYGHQVLSALADGTDLRVEAEVRAITAQLFPPKSTAQLFPPKPTRPRRP